MLINPFFFKQTPGQHASSPTGKGPLKKKPKLGRATPESDNTLTASSPELLDLTTEEDGMWTEDNVSPK